MLEVSKLFFLILLMAACLSSCSDSKSITYKSNKFLYKSQIESGISFKNLIQEQSGRNIGFYDYFYNGAGVGVGDFNNDGLDDVFIAGNDVSNRLFVNKGNFEFDDITEQSGLNSKKWSTGVSIVDINNDGYLDIYVCNGGPYLDSDLLRNDLYINNGDLTFTESAFQYNLARPSRSIQASFFDMDNDGDLDLWVMNHSLRNKANSPMKWLEDFNGSEQDEAMMEVNNLYRNEGDKGFTDISSSSGVQKPGFGLGLVVNDFNEDGLLDVYIANDYFIPDFLFINKGDGNFVDELDLHFGHVSYYSMGSDMADINNDGLNDLFTVDMTPADHIRNKTLMASMNTSLFSLLTEDLKFAKQYMFNSLYLNRGNGFMNDMSHLSGVAQTDWSWAPLIADFDNDGLKDIYVTNGYYRDTKDNDWRIALNKIRQQKGDQYGPGDYYNHLLTAVQKPISNVLYKNKNGFEFEDITDASEMSSPSFSNGAAYGDFDNDGDWDLVVNNLGAEAFVIENQSDGNFIRFRLNEDEKESPILHSRVTIYHEGTIQMKEYKRVRGYMSSVSPVADFGLGNTEVVDSVIIHWHGGGISRIENPGINAIHDIDKSSSIVNYKEKENLSDHFVDITKPYVADPMIHQENDFDEYEKEILLPHSQARLGPAIAVEDINGDGLDDFFVGGALGQAGKVYTQAPDGKFIPLSNISISEDRRYEDVGAKFLDIDKDGDQDLYVASGGSGDVADNSELLQDRLYLNDGSGLFSMGSEILPLIQSSTKTIIPIDWDQDGDQDLFVGGRVTPGKYPMSPRSYWLENNGGKFTDVSDRMEGLSSPGMITDGLNTDINQDGYEDLVLVGEWMPITFLLNQNGNFSSDQMEVVENSSGWWQSIERIDMDNDGIEEFIIGNIGKNNKFHPSPEKPFHVYANDFDESGSLDIVLSKKYNDSYVPVRGRECSSQQMPFISEKYETYKEFAEADIIDIYGDDKIEAAIHFTAVTFAHSLLSVKQDGYELVELPVESQLSPITGVVVKDFDGDGYDDVVMAGNIFDTEVETTSYDAGRGLILYNNEGKDFSADINIDRTGIFMYRNVKDLEYIEITHRKVPSILVSNNNSRMDIYLYREYLRKDQVQ